MVRCVPQDVAQLPLSIVAACEVQPDHYILTAIIADGAFPAVRASRGAILCPSIDYCRVRLDPAAPLFPVSADDQMPYITLYRGTGRTSIYQAAEECQIER